jgi:hypothetical protein
LILAISAHPVCLSGEEPFVPSPPLQICAQYNAGSCCDVAREQQVVSEYVGNHSTLFSSGFVLANNSTWTECDKKIIEIACLHCDNVELHRFTNGDEPLVCNDYCTSRLAQTCGVGHVACTGNCASLSTWCFPNTPTVNTGALRIAFGGYQGSNVVEIIKSPTDNVGVYLVTKDGLIYRIAPNASNASAPWIPNEPLLDITAKVNSGGEMGLLSAKFDRGYGSNVNGYLYAYYTDATSPLGPKVNKWVRFHVSNAADNDLTNDRVLDPSSECVFTETVKGTAWHNGGTILQTANGDLYLGQGDGGEQNDGANKAQDPQIFEGKILRIIPGTPPDPFAANACTGNNKYAIPVGNYYASAAEGRPEICSIGKRNPWSYDIFEDKIYGVDVGQNSYEELNRLTCGKNYGWSGYEGGSVFRADRAAIINASGRLQMPLIDYRHTGPIALTPYTLENLIGNSGSYCGVYQGDILPPSFRNGKWHIIADYTDAAIFGVYVDEENGLFFGETLVSGVPPIVRGGRDHNNEMIFIAFAYTSPSYFYTFAPLTAPVAGNGLCELNEDCDNTPQDCPGNKVGGKGQLYCCGNGELIRGNRVPRGVSCEGTAPPAA